MKKIKQFIRKYSLISLVLWLFLWFLAYKPSCSCSPWEMRSLPWETQKMQNMASLHVPPLSQSLWPKNQTLTVYGKKIFRAWNPRENIGFSFSPLFKFFCKICVRVLGDIMEKIYGNCKIMLSERKEREKNLNKTVLINNKVTCIFFYSFSQTNWW